MKKLALLTLTVSLSALAACQQTSIPDNSTETTAAVEQAPTVQDAKEFLEQAEKDIEALRAEAARIYWINANP